MPLEFRYDATSAGGGVFGSQKLPFSHGPDGEGLAPFVAQLRLTLTQRAQVDHMHVKGHSGELGNELCDIMARFSRRNPSSVYDRCLPTWPAAWYKHELWSWGWLSRYSGPLYPSLPAFEAEAFRLQSQVRQADPPQLGTQCKVFRHAEVLYQVSMATYNVLTLLDPGAVKHRAARASDPGLMIAGKRDILKKQFLQRGLWMIGMQETRLPTSAIVPDKEFLMLNSAADEHGHYGCSLWINLAHIYAEENGVKHRVRKEQVVVTHLSSRHLQVRLEAPRLQMTILVLHAPRIAAQGLDCVEAFWRDRARELRPHSLTSECVVLADANAHLGSVLSDGIGPAGAEEENSEGSIVQNFLQQVGCFAPSTFGEIHSGEHWTWCAPGLGGVKHRLDYAFVPLMWRSFAQGTSVWYDLESLQTRRDHAPLTYWCTFCKSQPATRYHTSVRQSVRPPRDLAPTDRKDFACRVGALQQVHWLADIDAQYACKVQQLLDIGSRFVEPPQRKPTNEYLATSTIDLVQERRGYRTYMCQEEHELKRRLLMIAFAAFRLLSRGRVFTDDMQRSVGQWLADIDHSLAQALERYDELTVAVRAAVKRDRVQYLEGLSEAITMQDLRHPRALYASVRKAFPRAASSRRSLFQPLPAVRLADGTLAQGPEAKALRWTEFFQAQEAGLQVTAAEYRERFRASGSAVFPEGRVFDVKALPGIGELEQQLHVAKYGKASGPDAVTAELLRVSVPHAATHFFQVCLKAALQVKEPVEWRGGALLCLAKRAAAAFECKAFRSILVASVVSKAHHRLLRAKLMPAFQDYKTELQSGQIAGTGVESLSLLVRTYQLRAQQRKQVSSLTFFDVKAAFYRVIRQALLKAAPDSGDNEFLEVLYDLGVPGDALPELVSHLQNMAVLAESGVGPHMQAQVSDLFQGSWFRMDGAGPLVATRRGTRPGDPLADLLFAFSFTAYLRSAEGALRAKGLSTQLEAPRHEAAAGLEDPPPELGCLAWADDYTHMQAVKEAAVLCGQVRAATGVLLTHATANGMVLTFADDKTSVLLSAECPRRSEAQVGIRPDDQGRPVLDVKDDITGQVHAMPVVSKYKHLGSITVANATPEVEVQYRYAQALSTLRPLHRKLFASTAIPLQLRKTLLRSLVVSKFVFSSASLILWAAQHRRRWGQCYLKLWRALLPAVSPEHQKHSYDVLALARAPSPLLAMAQARASLLQRILSSGPASLAYLLRLHWAEAPLRSWLGQFIWDIRAVSPYSYLAKNMLQAKEPVKELLAAFEEDSHWWGRTVKKACEAFHKDLLAWQEAGRPMTEPAAPTQAEGGFSCPLCNAAFRLRKHLGVHMAKVHQRFSVARHFVPVPYCLSCHRFYHTVARTQYHVRTTPKCLSRLAHVLRPMDMAEVLEVESQDRKIKQALKKGTWQAYEPAEPACVALGPCLPLYAEALGDTSDEDIALSRLQRQYRPPAAIVQWVRSFIDGASIEGPREDATDFWLRRPAISS